MILARIRSLHFAFALAVPMLAACSGAAAQGDGNNADDSTLLPDSGIAAASGGVVLAAASEAVQAYGRLATENTALSCTSANGSAGVITVVEVSTGKGVEVAGAAAAGPVSIVGAKGDGALALGEAATWDAETSSFEVGAAMVGQIMLPAAGSAPQSESDAETLFDAAFGPDARRGIALSNELKGPLGKILGFYGSSPESVDETSSSAAGTMAVGVISYEGKVLAIQTIGMGAMASYAK